MNRIDKIKMYKENKDKKELNNMTTEKQKYHVLMVSIINLQPRITELIKTANICTESGIEISMCRKKNGHIFYDSYKQGTFISNSISHKIGFIQGNGISLGYNPKTPITVMGIVNGGAFGELDFYTDGINAYSICRKTGTISEPRVEDMIKFIKGFNEFENAFYKYIDNIVD